MKDDQKAPEEHNTPPSQPGSEVKQDVLSSQAQAPEPTSHTPPRPLDEFAAASRAMAGAPPNEGYDDYAKHAASYTAPNKALRIVVVIVAVVVLAALAGAAYYWFMHKDKAAKPAKQQTASQVTSQKVTQTVPDISSETQHYKSTNFALEFDHPKDWTVSEVAASGKLAVASPTVKLGETTGKVTFTIRSKQLTLAEFSKGNAVAARESEKIVYTKPGPDQRGQTYISFLHYAGASGAATTFDGIYITGNTGYKAAQAIPKADFDSVDPIISLTFTKADGTTALSLPTAVWGDAKVVTPLKNLLMSLVIQ